MLKDAYEVIKDLFPLDRLKVIVKERSIKKQHVRLFSEDFASHQPEVTRLMDYHSWTQEAYEWQAGSDELCAMSFREMGRWWADPSLYAVYDGAVRSFINKGGIVRRVVVVEREFFDPVQQLVLLQTCMRHTLLGMEPVMIHSPSLVPMLNELGVNCDLFGVVGDRVAYYNLFFGQEALCLKTYAKKQVAQAWSSFQAVEKKAIPFQKWLRQVDLSSKLASILPHVEEEADLILKFAAF